jgi:hypothetical protein
VNVLAWEALSMNRFTHQNSCAETGDADLHGKTGKTVKYFIFLGDGQGHSVHQ